MSFLEFWEELESIEPVDLSGLRLRFPAGFNEQEYSEYLDRVEEQLGEQELPEDYQF